MVATVEELTVSINHVSETVESMRAGMVEVDQGVEMASAATSRRPLERLLQRSL